MTNVVVAASVRIAELELLVPHVREAVWSAEELSIPDRRKLASTGLPLAQVPLQPYLNH